MKKSYYLITYRRELLFAETVTPRPMVQTELGPEEAGFAVLGIRTRREEHFPNFGQQVTPEPVTTINKQVDHVTEIVYTESPHIHFLRMMKKAENMRRGQNSEDLALLYVKELTPEEIALLIEDEFINEAPVPRSADAEEPVSPE